MSEPKSSPLLPPTVRQALDAVRFRIRAYVALDGMAILVGVVGVIFWLGLALDHYFEPSPSTRRIALSLAACVALYTAYRYLLRRLIIPISDTTLAVLLERRFPALKDHVITAVDIAQPGRAHAY